VEAYFQVALALFENLFGDVPRIDEKTPVHTKTGEFCNFGRSSITLFARNYRPKRGPLFTGRRSSSMAYLRKPSRYGIPFVHSGTTSSTVSLLPSQRTSTDQFANYGA